MVKSKLVMRLRDSGVYMACSCVKWINRYIGKRYSYTFHFHESTSARNDWSVRLYLSGVIEM